MRVLLVEDHPPLLRALRQGLEEEGFAVDVAIDGEEADVKCRTTGYDVVVLDIMLPKIDGLTLLKKWLVEFKFRDWDKHRTTPATLGRLVTADEKQARAEEIAKLLGDNRPWHSLLLDEC